MLFALKLMLDRKANSVSDVCLPADKQNFFSFSRVSSTLLWAVIISSNLRSFHYPERKYMPNCIVHVLKSHSCKFLPIYVISYRRLKRITSVAIFCIQKLIHEHGRAFEGHKGCWAVTSL